MTILVYGAGNTGQAIVHYLWRQASVFVLDRDKDLVDRLNQQYDIVAHCGDLSDIDFLTQVWQTPQPHVLVAVTDQPESNLLAAYICQSMSPDLHVLARVDSPQYYTKSHQKQQHGFNLFSPYRFVSQTLIDLAQRPNCIDYALIDGEANEARELWAVRLTEQHPWCGQTVQAVGSMGIDIVQLVQGEKAWVAQPHDRLIQGQCVYAVTPRGEATKTPLEHVMVGVDGAMTPWLLQGLADLAVDVTVVCANEHNLDWVATHWPQCRLVQGDITMPSVLGPEITPDTVMISASKRPTDNLVASAMALGCGARHAVTWVHHHLGPDSLNVQGAGVLVPTGPSVLSHVLAFFPRLHRLRMRPMLGGTGGVLVSVTLGPNDPLAMGLKPDLSHATCRLLSKDAWIQEEEKRTTLVSGKRITFSVMNEGLEQLWAWIDLNRHDDPSGHPNGH